MNKIEFRKLTSATVLGAALTIPMLLPATAAAQSRGGRDSRRSDDRNGDRGRENGNQRDGDRRYDERRTEGRWESAGYGRSNGQRGNYGHDDRGWGNDRYRYDNRQSSKEGWRGLGVLGGAVGVYGLLTGDRNLAALGLGGGLYSAYRYEEDRKSQSREGRGRYELFRRDAFDHDGHHYVRRERTQGGQRYYYFDRGR